MGVVEPGRPLVVEIGEGAPLEDRGGLPVDRNDAIGKARHHLRHAFDEIGRVEPRIAQFIEAPRRLGDRYGARIAGIFARRPVRRQALGEREVFKSRRRGIPRIISDPQPRAKPKLGLLCGLFGVYQKVGSDDGEDQWP